MHPGLTYEVQKAVIEERLRNAKLAQQCRLAHDRGRARRGTAARVPRPRRLRAMARLLAVIWAGPSREPWLRR